MTNKTTGKDLFEEATGQPWKPGPMFTRDTMSKVLIRAARRINRLTQERDEAVDLRDHWFREREKALDENDRLRSHLRKVDDAWRRYEKANYLSDEELDAEKDLYQLMSESPVREQEPEP